MHGKSFSQVVCAMAGRLNRRRAAGLVAATGLATLLGQPADSNAKKKKKCKGGLTTCKIKKGKKKKRVCVNAQNDPANCGGCGRICASGQSCRNGVCTGSSCTPDPNSVTCAGKCGPTPNNCGTIVQCACSTYVYGRTITTSAVGQNGVLIFPYGVAEDSTGAIYVTDQFNNRVQVFDANGTFVRQWGGVGSANGKFSRPVGIAIDGADTVYVVDAFNRRVQMFDTDGTYLGQLGGWNLGLGDASEIAFDSGGNIYVSFQKGVRKFSSAGVELANWTNGGSFTDLRGIAFDSQDRGYVADYPGNRVVRFTTALALIDQFGAGGSGNGQFNGPIGIGIDGSDRIFVVDSGNQRVQRFVLSGATVIYDGQTGAPGAGNGDFGLPAGIGIGQGGALFVADNGSSNVQKFTNALAFQSRFGVMELGMVVRPIGVAVDGEGRAHVVDSDARRITRFAATDTPELTWGYYGGGNGGFISPRGIGAGAGNTIYVADTITNLVQAFTASGVFQDEWGGSGAGDGQMEPAGAIAVDAGGKVFVTDPGHNRVQAYTSAGVFVDKWGTSGSGPGQFSNPTGIAIDAGNAIFVSDNIQHRVQVFTNGGDYQSEWPSGNASSLALDRSLGRIFAIERTAKRVDMYSLTGAGLGSFGEAGSGEGKLNQPEGIAVAPNGDVYVTDVANRCVQVYVPASGPPRKQRHAGGQKGHERRSNARGQRERKRHQHRRRRS